MNDFTNEDRRYSSNSVRDVFCGYVSLDGVFDSQAACFAKALQEFSYSSECRQVYRHADANCVIYSSSLKSDMAIESTRQAFFVGFASGLTETSSNRRDLAKHFLAKDQLQESDFNNFTDSRFSGVIIDSQLRKVRLLCDYFGKRKLFYRIVEDTLYFASEFQVIAKVAAASNSLDRQALREYLTLGSVVGSRTLLEEVKSISAQEFAEWNGADLICHSLANRSLKSDVSETLDSKKVYQSFKDVLSFFVKDLGLKIADLTGGADSRLTLSVLKEISPQTIYTCENQNLDTQPNYFFDFSVMQMLKEKYALKEQFDFEEFRSGKKFQKTAFETHRCFDGDMYESAISSMYGGELFGGWAYDWFFDEDKDLFFKSTDAEVIEMFPPTYFENTHGFSESISRELERLHYKDPKFLLSILLLCGAPAYFREGLKPWFESYQLTNRKISAFLGDAVLRSLNVPGAGQKISSYKFYLDLYQSCAADYLTTPFHSGFSKIFPDEVPDIRSYLVHGSENQKTDTAANVSTKAKGVMDQRLSLLEDYLIQVLDMPSLASEVGSLSGSASTEKVLS